MRQDEIVDDNIKTEGSENATLNGEVNARKNTVVEPRLNYGQLIDLMNLRKPETDDERAAREKREQRAIRFARIGDTLSAMHNAYANARGVKPMTQTTLADKLRARYDYLTKEREAKDAMYYNGYAKMLGMQNQEDYNKSMLEFRKAEAEAKRAAEEAARKRELKKLEEDGRYKRAMANAALIRANRTGNVGGYRTEVIVKRDKFGREIGRITTRTSGGGSSTTPSNKPTKGGGSSNTEKKPTMLNF